ncbi:hypothetical protein VNI00_000075 [Paramarasmius palmivorus]|uniref:Uncharacterized protein n=1 Tax=Paramarasmius palmivorus TaxID=297713 RepID=A0AAW0EEP6_9AGAR
MTRGRKRTRNESSPPASSQGASPIVLSDDEANTQQLPSKKTQKEISSIKKPAARDAAFKALYPGKSDVEILEAQIQEWDNSSLCNTYKHFDLTKITMEISKGVMKNPSTFVTRPRFDSSTSNLAKHLKLCMGKIATPENTIQQYAVGSAYDKGQFRFKGAIPELRSFILDFIALHEKHEGEYLSQKFVESLARFGIQDKAFGLIGNNASNNEKMVEYIGKALPTTPAGATSRVQCLLHIMNLVIVATVSPFTIKSKTSSNDDEVEEIGAKEEQEEDEEDEEDAEHEDPAQDAVDAAILEDPDLDDEVAALLAERALILPDVTDEERKLAHSAFLKSRAVARKIHWSWPLKVELKRICEREGWDYKTLKWLITTRWNSLHKMISSHLGLRHALDELCNPPEYNNKGLPHKGTKSKKKSPLNKFKMSEEEWELFEAIEPLLLEFVQAMQAMETNKRPLLQDVICIIDKLNNKLEAFVTDTVKLLGLTILDKYYAKTDDSVIYRAAMLLHPRMKTSYFTKAAWPDEWVNSAKAVL